MELGKIGKAWSKSLEMIGGSPLVLLPFGVIALLELLGMAVIFIFQQPPLVRFISPVIVRFWGEKFLRYPYNLLLLPQILRYAQVFLAVVLGTFASGAVISGARQYYQNSDFRLGIAFKEAFFKYAHLLMITVAVFLLVEYIYGIEKMLLFKIMAKGTEFLGLRRESWVLLGIIGGIMSSGVIHALFVFAQPVIMIDGKNFIIAVFRNFSCVFKNIIPVLIIVLVPLMIYTPFVLLKSDLFALMKRTFPEIVFVILAMSIIFSFFINVFITLTAAFYYLDTGKTKDEG